MSREEDLKNLRKLEEELISAYEMADECDEITDRIKYLEKERDNPKAITYNKLATNNFETLDKQYRDEWKAKHSSIRLYRILVSMILTFVLIGLTLVFISDMFLGTNYINSPLTFRSFVYANSIGLLCVLAVVHIILSVILGKVPKWIFGKER